MHMSNESILVILFVGLVAGWLAGQIVRGGEQAGRAGHAHARAEARSAVAPRGETPRESDGDVRVARHRSTM